MALLILLAGVGRMQAQSGDVAIGVKGGNSALFGAFGAVSAEAKYAAKDYFAIRGGAQYNTYGRVAAEVRPQYFHDLSFGRVSAELLCNYTNQGKQNNIAIGCGASLDVRYIWVTLGYYYRAMMQGGDTINEPFNIYYELGIRCLPKLEKGDLNVIFTNSRIFELERHYQPSFAVEGWWYPTDKWGLQVGVNYKPAGMFNISSDFYQVYGNVGVCYKW